MGVAASRQEAFWEACGFGHKERVKKFLEAGDIDVNWVSYTHDCCPIHVASQGKPEIVKMLIDAKCNVNVQDIRGLTPVHHAAMKGHADIIQILIEAGADVNTQDKNNWTALHCAAYWNHCEAVEVLLNMGADVNIQNKDKRTALHETARSQEKDDLSLGEIARMLVSAGSDVNIKGCSDLGDLEADFTGLMYAAYHNHPDVASALIDGGCDINAHGSNLWTALHWAADRGRDEMVYLLLGAGADPTKRGQRNELAADRADSTDLKEILLNAVNMFNELAIIDSQSPTTQKSFQSKIPENKVTTELSVKTEITNMDNQGLLIEENWTSATTIDSDNVNNIDKEEVKEQTYEEPCLTLGDKKPPITNDEFKSCNSPSAILNTNKTVEESDLLADKESSLTSVLKNELVHADNEIVTESV